MVAQQTLTLFVWVQILVPLPKSLGLREPRLFYEVWLSLVERYVRDVEAAGSNPVTSTSSVTLHPIRDHHLGGGRDFFAHIFICGRIAVLRSKMGVFQTPKQFLPGVDRAPARTTPALPAKSHAAPPLFACKRDGCEFRASETRPSKSNVSETWLVGSAVANNFLRKRTRALFFSGLQSLYKIPAGEAQRDFPVSRGHPPDPGFPCMRKAPQVSLGRSL